MLTNEQRENLRALADYLDTGVTKYLFDMSLYWHEYECGTTACAAGHAPFVLGIPNEKAFPNGKFDEYTVLGYLGARPGSREYNWIFNGSWWGPDNTPRGAAARIYYYLENGVPDNHLEQMNGTAPLCYTVHPLPTITPTKEAADAR